MKVDSVYGINTQIRSLDKASQAKKDHQYKKYLKNKLQARGVSLLSLTVDTLWAAVYPVVTIAGAFAGGLAIMHESSLRKRKAARVHSKIVFKSLAFPFIKIAQIPPQTIGIMSPELEAGLHKRIGHREWEMRYGEKYVFHSS